MVNPSGLGFNFFDREKLHNRILTQLSGAPNARLPAYDGTQIRSSLWHILS